MKVFLIFTILILTFNITHWIDFPLDKWKIIYHSYTDYTIWDSQLYIFDLENKINQNISENWSNVYNSMNAHISSDWKYLTFMWMHKTPNWENWDIYLWDFISPEPINLTSKYNKRNEDPKFSPEGKNIVFKQWSWNHKLNIMQYDIKILDLEWNIVDVLTDDVEENSMPYYTADGKNIIYSRWVWAKSSIYMINISNKQKKLLYDEKNIQEYYPIAFDNKNFYYTSWEKKSKNDQIYLWDINSSKRKLLPINRSNYNFSDSYNINNDLILFSSNYNSVWWYDLYVGNIKTWDIWSLKVLDDSINSNKHELWWIYFLNNWVQENYVLDDKVLKKADELVENYSKDSEKVLPILYNLKFKNTINYKQKALITYLIKWFKK